MTPVDPLRVEALFEAALALPAEERMRFVERSCGDDASLRAELKSLLDHNSQAGTFLESPVTGEREEPVELPERIGPYRVLEVLGEGGFGIVYLADQTEPVRRKVAVKVLKLGMDSRQVLARFERERLALALMDHPNVARVLDAGLSAEGRPYFVMEHVAGMPITAYCDRHRLKISQRLELFMAVCRAAQHAHQKGIIHRDLKPSNVLVSIIGDTPTPKIIDFGVAKATAQRLSQHTLHTEQGQVVGTPEYMSPEQAEMSSLDIDTRTDIYALGVLLYELLVGHLPFDSKTLRSGALIDLQRLIREQDPPRPSVRYGRLGADMATVAGRRGLDRATLDKALRGDLDWIVMKAMEKDRTRRYATASEFENDIHRYLANEPVVARPPTRRYRTGKFLRRHRLSVTAVVGLFVLLMAFGIVSMRLYRRAEAQRVAASAARDEAQAVTGFLDEMLRSASPGESGRAVTVQEVLDEAAGTVEKRFQASPNVLARLLTTIGATYDALGKLDRSRPYLEQALELRRQHLGPHHDDTLITMVALADLAADQGRHDEAEALYNEALAAHRAREMPPDDPRSLTVKANLGLLYQQMGRHDQAEAILVPVLAAQRRVLGPDAPTTLVTADNVSSLYILQRRFAEAEPLVVYALEHNRRLRGADHPNTIVAMANMALLYQEQNRMDEAIALQKEAMAACERVFGDEHHHTMSSLNNLGRLLLRQERYEEAAEVFQRTIAVRQRTLDANHPSTLIALHNLGHAYAGMGRCKDARPYQVAAVSGARLTWPDGHDFLGVALMRYGMCLQQLGEYKAAEDALLEAYQVLSDRLGPTNERTRAVVDALLDLYGVQGRSVDVAAWNARLADPDPDGE